MGKSKRMPGGGKGVVRLAREKGPKQGRDSREVRRDDAEKPGGSKRKRVESGFEKMRV
jgi:hypothetical protein